MRVHQGCSYCCKYEFRAKSFLLGHHNPDLFVQAQWPRLPLWFYPLYKAALAAVFTVFIVLSGVLPYGWYNRESNRIKWFIYLTNHGFFFITVCLIYQTIMLTFVTCCYKTGIRDGVFVNNQPWYLKVQWVLYNLCTPVAILITILFWAIIYPTYTSIYWIDVITHTMNTVYVIIDIFITAMPLRILHFWHCLTYFILYVIFSVVYQAAGGTNASDLPYIYSPLDWKDPGTALIYVAAALGGLLVIWFFLLALYSIRLYIYYKIYQVEPETRWDEELDKHNDEKAEENGIEETRY